MSKPDVKLLDEVLRLLGPQAHVRVHVDRREEFVRGLLALGWYATYDGECDTFHKGRLMARVHAGYIDIKYEHGWRRMPAKGVRNVLLAGQLT